MEDIYQVRYEYRGSVNKLYVKAKSKEEAVNRIMEKHCEPLFLHEFRLIEVKKAYE